MVANAYTSIIFKWFTDIKYISLARILTYIGAIGLFYSLIFLFIFSYISCSNEENNALSYACKIEYEGNSYYENYRSLSNIKIDSFFYIDVFIEIPLYYIEFFINIF